MAGFPSKLLALFLASFLASTLMISATKSTLSTRLKLDQAGPNSCWDALFELQSCSGEVVLFFLNGEAQLGANCCQAITTIEQQCWPSMLASLGITADESSILRGYCDKTAESVAAAPPPAPPIQRCYSFPRLLP